MSVRSSLRQSIVLLRLHNCLIAAASVLVGSYLAGSSVPAPSVFAAAAAFLVAAGGYALNDLYDVESDRVSKPWRPLPSERIGKRTAVVLVIATWATGLALSAPAGYKATGFVLSWMVFVWLYSIALKSAGVWGHVLISAVASSGFILGAAIGGRASAGLLPFAVSFVFHFAREIVKGTADVAGDIAAGFRTLPARMGERERALVCAASIAAVMVLSILPFATGAYGFYYIVPVLAIQPVLAVCIHLIVTAESDDAARARAHGRVATLLKAVMPVGLLAFVLGGL